MTAGKSARADVLRVLGDPKRIDAPPDQKANDLQSELWYVYDSGGEFPGEVTAIVEKRSNILLGINLNPDSLSKEEAVKHFGPDYVLTRYDFDECLGNEESAPLYVLRQVSFDTVEGDLFNEGMNENAGPGTVLLVPNRLYRTPTDKDLAYFQADYAWTALHETLHLGKRGWYSDQQLAEAAYSVAGLAKPTWNGKGNKEDYFSNLLDQELKKHCPKPETRTNK